MGAVLQGRHNVGSWASQQGLVRPSSLCQAPCQGCRADFGMAEVMHPHCLTESQCPGTDPCACHSQWLGI